jgi:DNA polymerase-3 subunit gamma/tau
MLSAAAFNAFLKTLEEPPSYVIFILATTEKQKVIPTILSRCQIYDFSRITIDDTVRHLQYVASRENVQAEEAALNVIAQKADGGMRDALSMFDQAVSFTNGNVTYQAVIDNLNILDYDYYFRFTENILNGNVRNSLLLLNEILGKGFDAQNVITGLASHFRNLLVCKDEETLVLFEVASSVKEQYKEISKKCPDQFLFRAIELCNTCDLNYRDSRNKRLLVELTLIKLCQLLNVPTPPAGGDGSGKLGSVSAPAGAQAAQPRASVQAPNVSASVKGAQQEPVKQSTQTPPATPNIDKIMTSGASSSGTSRRMARPSQMTSLKDLRAKAGDEGAASEQPVTSAKKESSIFNQKEFDDAWNSIANKYDKVNMFLKDIMLNYRPRLSDGGVLTMHLVNAGQKEEINSNMIDIITELRTKLRNSYVHIDIVMEEQDKIKVPITSAEKYEHLANINPLLRQLTKEFDLRLN